ncbi:calcium-binding protein [Novosphingobium cyanobacteriorum]|uniref:Calcium-binding protein n=1 Tax=Novosphingobium cyanobacteriorum TaxID=3024215 RepID=A0ABT6CEY4_9SPHN|nr:calcium-binding protein [Novosphingobium cyanobacteriorum]MDF8332469.1 calcium-binding protein [Novosphingobium cyanobacteriorum]
MAELSSLDPLPLVRGTSGDDTLYVSNRSDISALSGNDRIEIDGYGPDFSVNGGKGFDTLGIYEEHTLGAVYRFNSLVSVEKLEFHGSFDTYLAAFVQYSVPDGATGQVNIKLPGEISGSICDDESLIVNATGGMNNASVISLPKIVFTTSNPDWPVESQRFEEIILRADDDQDYTFRANSTIADQHVRQTLIGAGGNDTLIGSAGDDNLIDHGGTATQMLGGDGDDYMLLDFGRTAEPPTISGTINGGRGYDTLALQSPVVFTGNLQSTEEVDILSTMTLNGSLGKIEKLVLGQYEGYPFVGWHSADLYLTNAVELPRQLHLSGDGTIYVSGASQFDASHWIIDPDDDYPSQHLAIQIAGTAGDDRLIGSNTRLSFDPYDYLRYGDWFHATLGNDVIDGGTSLDLLDFDDATFSSGITLNLGTAAVQDIAPGATLSVRNIEEVTGTSFNDTITAAAFENTIHGGGGNDVLKARAGTGTLFGPQELPVGDTLFGDGGRDRLIGSTAGDKLYGGNGSDTLIGVSASSETGGDFMSGGDGDDRLVGSTAHDTIYGDAGDDVLLGSYGEAIASGDYLSGGDGNDRLTGSLASDTLDGGAGDDILIGRGGDGISAGDTLYGGDGDDLLVGGIGSDSFYTGAGEDHIRFNAIPTQQVFVDKVWWDSEGLDRIELSRATFTAFAKSGALSADAFYTGAGVTAAHDETDRILYDTTSGMLFYDADGNGTVRGAIPIARFYPVDGLVPVLEASDFLIVA